MRSIVLMEKTEMALMFHPKMRLTKHTDIVIKSITRTTQLDTLKKEVIGGYILFSGNGEPTDVAVSKFRKTI